MASRLTDVGCGVLARELGLLLLELVHDGEHPSRERLRPADRLHMSAQLGHRLDRSGKASAAGENVHCVPVRWASSKWKKIRVHVHMSFSARTMPSHRVSPPTGTKMATSGPFFSHVSAVSTKGASTVLAFWKVPEV
jgi:hypothetical protein